MCRVLWTSWSLSQLPGNRTMTSRTAHHVSFHRELDQLSVTQRGEERLRIRILCQFVLDSNNKVTFKIAGGKETWPTNCLLLQQAKELAKDKNIHYFMVYHKLLLWIPGISVFQTLQCNGSELEHSWQKSKYAALTWHHKILKSYNLTSRWMAGWSFIEVNVVTNKMQIFRPWLLDNILVTKVFCFPWNVVMQISAVHINAKIGDTTTYVAVCLSQFSHKFSGHCNHNASYSLSKMSTSTI